MGTFTKVLMGSGTSIHVEPYLDNDTASLSDESMDDISRDTANMSDESDSENESFLSNVYHRMFWALLQKCEDVLGTFTKVLINVFVKAKVKKYQRKVDCHANDSCHHEREVHDKISM